MISFVEGLKLIQQHALDVSPQMRSALDAVGLPLARDVIAPIDLPPFANSAVDGFAVNSGYAAAHTSLPIMAEVRACAQDALAMPADKTIAIMTGAPVPHGADAVVMKEDVLIINGVAHIQAPVVHNNNIRFRGEDCQQGEIIARKNSIVTPALVGVFHALGLSHVVVAKPPRIRIISTGDELVDAGQPLAFGQVYYLMGPMLTAQCRAVGITDVVVERVADDKEAIALAIARARDADIVLITGGMSKGEYDLVRPALSSQGVEELFYQGAWRPGKPLYFGRRGTQRFFGLPGNPVAAFVCFHVFVRALLMGSSLRLKTGIMKADFVKKTGFTMFARAVVDETQAISVLPAQGSHQIVSLSRANALAVLHDERTLIKAGEIASYFELVGRL